MDNLLFFEIKNHPLYQEEVFFPQEKIIIEHIGKNHRNLCKIPEPLQNDEIRSKFGVLQRTVAKSQGVRRAKIESAAQEFN